MRLHPKIDQSELSPDGLLLTPLEIERIRVIEAFMEGMRDDFYQFIGMQRQNQDLLQQYQRIKESIHNPFEWIDKFLIVQAYESNKDYQKRILEELSAYALLLQSEGAQFFVMQLKDSWQQMPVMDKYVFYEIAYRGLEHNWEQYQDSAVDHQVIAEFEEKIAFKEQEAIEIEAYKQALIDKVDAFKAAQDVDFELDDTYRLIKIFKNKSWLSHSVLYVISAVGQSVMPVILYHGDSNHLLGEGGFARVKLCQDMTSGEWWAVKIQRSLMKATSLLENEALAHFNRLKAESTRVYKYYVVQQLLPGVDLRKHITISRKESFLIRFELLKKAALLVSDMHQNYLHRDLKPENLMWDAQSQNLYLCDFGMACKLMGSEESVLDLSGSGTYLAPEIDDKNHRGQVKYSKKSDIYALGKVFEDILHGYTVPAELVKLVQQMCKANPDERIPDAAEVYQKLVQMKLSTQVWVNNKINKNNTFLNKRA